MSQSKAASMASLRLMNLVGALRALPSLPSPDPVEQWGLDGLATIRAAVAKAAVWKAKRLTPDAGGVRIVVPAGAGDAGPAGLGR